MTKSNLILAAVGAVISVGAIATPALGDSMMPKYTYKKVSPNGEFVFVMISPLPVDIDAGTFMEKYETEIRDIRRVYSTSGLYRNDGSTTPLWTVEWYAFDVEVPSDGVHLIRHGLLGYSMSEEALSFYANGQLMRTYQVGEFIDTPLLLPRSVSHFQWCKDDKYNDTSYEYEIWTYDGNRFVFDARTGELVAQSRPIRNAQLVFYLSITLLSRSADRRAT